MQLFVTQPRREGEHIILDEERVVKYMGRVLRMKVGDICALQAPISSDQVDVLQRYTMQIQSINKKEVVGVIIDCKKHVKNMSNTSLIVALPNKFSKVELMVQKLTEVGIDDIILRPAQRSLLKTISSQRMKRLHTIVLESVEQCKRWTMPQVRLVEDISSILKGKEVVVFDFVPSPPAPLPNVHQQADSLGEGSNQLVGERTDVVGVVGPEGHFGEKDYVVLDSVPHAKKSLGEHVLRTETAAIVGAWWLVNREL